MIYQMDECKGSTGIIATPSALSDGVHEAEQAVTNGLSSNACGSSLPVDPENHPLESLQPQKTWTKATKNEKPIIIRYYGPLGIEPKKWCFPWRLCQKWQGMQELIRQAFVDNPVIVETIMKGAFELEGPDKCIIIPQLWETFAEPGMKLNLKFRDSSQHVPPPHVPPPHVPPPYVPSPFFSTPYVSSPYVPKAITSRTTMSRTDTDYSSDESSAGLSRDELRASKRKGSKTQGAKSALHYVPKIGRLVKFYSTPRHMGEQPVFMREREYQGDIVIGGMDERSGTITVLQEIVEVQSRKDTPTPYPPGVFPLPGQESKAKQQKSLELVLQRDDVIMKKVLRIRSPFLLNALRAIIKYSSVAPSGHMNNLKDGTFDFPFPDLCRHKPELLDYQKCHPSRDQHLESENEQCDLHIDVLLKYLNDQSDIRLEESEMNRNKKHPTTTFGSLWLLLKPGSDVYVRENGQLNAYVIESISGGTFGNQPRLRDDRAWPYSVDVWNLAYKGSSKTIWRKPRLVTVPVFDGEREIASLPVFPAQFHHDEPDQESLADKLIRQGKSYVDLVKAPAFREYSGNGRRHTSQTYDRERVVVIPAAANPPKKTVRRTYEPDDDYSTDYDSDPGPLPLPQLVGVPGTRARTPMCPCEKCEKYRADKSIHIPLTYGSYDNLDPNSSEFTDHQYMLCESHIEAFFLKDHFYDNLDVGGITEPIMNTHAIDQLVMKTVSNKSLLKAICNKYNAREKVEKAYSVDFIRGKGEGQVILLHGPPGTGKTLTAESVAEFTNRPLLAITAADLGHHPAVFETKLLKFFKNANDWGAIVLLDEADVYLERRSTEDLRRNSIVSIFLRALDYFKGILFLTTNRVGSFDEAFMSRIHVQIGYDPLDQEARRQIWNGYFEKLRTDFEAGGREIRYDWGAKEYAQRSPEVSELHWNGREIRNALDEATDGKVPLIKESHLRHVVRMSKSFKDYMKSTHEDLDDSEMAFRSGLRDDTKRHDN